MRSCVWENPLQMSGIGRGLSSAEVMRQATASYSRLVREMAAKESPVTENKVSVMAAKDSRPVREEVVESSDKVSVGSLKEPVVFWVGQEAGRHSLWPPMEWPTSPNLVEMWSSHREGGITGIGCTRCLAVACGPGN